MCCHERYLGLPGFCGKNKISLFNGIKDRILNKIKGWRSYLFSVGGKDVLIKAVLHAIPVYSMNLFRLPKGLLEEI